MEIATAVGGAILSASFQVLFDKFSSPEMLKFARQQQVLSEIEKWQKILMKIHAVVDDAEERQMTDRSVKIWLDELSDLAYDVEDILDEFTTEALRRKTMVEPQASTSKVRKLIPTCCTGFNPSSIKFNMKMESEIKKITTKLQEIVERQNDLNLREFIGRRSNIETQRPPTTSLVNEAKVYGRENDKKAILELLTAKATNAEVFVIPILGMGGIGKTTLAQLVYNDNTVKFDTKAWVCVSEDFNVSRITKTILDQLETCHAKDLNSLQVKLKAKLSGKKFLIVLDDVWNVKYDDWTLFQSPLEAAAPESRIIVTTRIQDVSTVMGIASVYMLDKLNSDDCLSIFAQHALGATNFDAHAHLKDIGLQIVKKCKGLPLAAKALGGLLRSKPNRGEWEEILKSKIWDLPEEKSSILPVLRLSYYHLPSHLKRCFAYCAIFPKDYEFDEEELILLWMAEGLLQQPKGKKQMEDLGREYFHDLLSRSFFHQSSSEESRYVMHDLINDLAQCVAGDTCYNFEDKLEGDFSDTSLDKTRHSSFTSRQYDISQRFEVFYQMKGLRTLLALHAIPSWVDRYMSSKVLYHLLPKLRYLRVLSLSGYQIFELPNSVVDLKHLRYLNLSYTMIKSLPESVSDLFNLQTLRLRGCTKLIKLPIGIYKLINLRYLDISDTNSLLEMPLHIGNLTSLQVLTNFTVRNCQGLGIRELKKLSHLRGCLSILGLHNVVDIQDARVANLKEKHGLNELEMEWSGDFQDSRNERDELHVLRFLQPHGNLKNLNITFYGGAQFPSWISDPSCSNLEYLNLCDCRKITSLPSLGLLSSLKVLLIKGMNGVKRVGLEFCGDGTHFNKSFPSLVSLTFRNMAEWEEWSSPISVDGQVEGIIFPSLCELKILGCPKLVGKLPSYLPSLINLDIGNCPQLANSLEGLPSLRECSLEGCNVLLLKGVVNVSFLTILRITRISELACLHKEVMEALVALEDLEIVDCDELTSLWQDGGIIENLSSLKSLIIWSCPQLVSLVGGEGELLPCNLEHLDIDYCGNLEKLPNGLHNLTSLRQLTIRSCPKLVSFPAKGLPYSLKCLILCNCDTIDHFMWMNDDNNTSQLEELNISYCSSLASFPTSELPTALKTLQINGCTQLQSLSERMFRNNTALEEISIVNCVNLKSLPLEYLHNLTHLSKLQISGCPAIQSFPEMALFIPNLSSFQISDCVNLVSLPYQMHNLMSLQYLRISECPSILSFPEAGLPLNLTVLIIDNCENLKQPMSEWGLHSLTSLERFSISDTSPPDMISFPDDECLLLPTSLIEIQIECVKNLKFLSKGIQNLTSLEGLDIKDCPKLRSLPKDGLPTSLGRLTILKCPLLEERCLENKGEYWPILEHIPCFEILL